MNRPTPQPPSALSLETYLPYRLSLASNAVSRLLSRAYEARFGVTLSEWRVLAVLSFEPMPQVELANRTSLDKGAVSRAAHALIKRGFVVRAPDPIDGRSHTLNLTLAGQAMCDQITPAAEKYERALSRAFSAEEIADFKNKLVRLERAAFDLCDSVPGCPERYLNERIRRQAEAESAEALERRIALAASSGEGSTKAAKSRGAARKPSSAK